MQTVKHASLDLNRYVRPGDGIVVGQGTGEPQTLTEMLVRQRHDLRPGPVFIGSATFSRTFEAGSCDGLDLTGYGGAGNNRKLIKAGVLKQYPVQISQVPRYFGDTIPCDVTLVQVGPRRPDGTYSYSLISDYSVDAVRKARVVIAESNVNAPDTYCDEPLREDEITVLVQTDRPLLQVQPAPPRRGHRGKDRPSLRRVHPRRLHAADRQWRNPRGHHRVAGRSTRLGTAHWNDRRCNRAADRTRHRNQCAQGGGSRRSISGCLWGTDRLYRFVHRNPAVRVSRLSHTHAPEILGQLRSLVSINSALEVELTGQVNAESINGEYVGAVGGQIDYVRAAARSQTGASIIALPSTAKNGTITRIVPRLSGPGDDRPR